MWSGGGLSSLSRVDAQGAMGAGPGASEVTGGQGSAGEKGMAQCDSGSVGGGLTLLLDGVKFMFFLWK